MIKEKFTTEDTGMGNKHIKRCSTSLVIIISIEQLELSHTAGGNIKWWHCFGKVCQLLSKATSPLGV